jgi:hypothetical protein
MTGGLSAAHCEHGHYRGQGCVECHPPLPWVLGGCNGRGITTPTGYIGDGLIADFDTKAHAEFALERINKYDALVNLVREIVGKEGCHCSGEIIGECAFCRLDFAVSGGVKSDRAKACSAASVVRRG